MLFNHEDERDEEECRQELSKEDLEDEFTLIIATIGGAQHLNVITIGSNHRCTALFLPAVSTSADCNSDKCSDTLADPEDNGEGEVSHPVGLTLFEESG